MIIYLNQLKIRKAVKILLIHQTVLQFKTQITTETCKVQSYAAAKLIRSLPSNSIDIVTDLVTQLLHFLRLEICNTISMSQQHFKNINETYKLVETQK